MIIFADEEALYRRLKEWTFNSNLELVVTALNRAAHASAKVSQNAVAAACARAFQRLYTVAENPDMVVREAITFFEDSSSMVYRQVAMEVFEHQGKRGFLSRRGGCWQFIFWAAW